MFRGGALMDIKCKKLWLAGLPCPSEHPPAALQEPATRAQPPSDDASLRGINFGTDPRADLHAKAGVPIPGYDAPALPLKPLRDPSLSLVALSGVDPSGEVKVEVPLVQNNSIHSSDQALAGRRVGFAELLVQGNRREPIEHRAAFLQALITLRQAGAQLVPVPAQWCDTRLQFNLHTRNEIDEHISDYRLDALVSDSRTAAFHAACWSGYPGLGEHLEEGATLWFYGARWAGDSLAALVREYRNLLCRSRGATARDNARRHEYPGV